jgi:hypothetical protein
MKPPKAEETWLCQLCGKVKEREEHHVNTHRHKFNMKKIEDACAAAPIRQQTDDRRWGGA